MKIYKMKYINNIINHFFKVVFFVIKTIKQKQMRTQLTDLRKELRDIESTLSANILVRRLPKETETKLLDRAQYIRDVIFNIQ